MGIPVITIPALVAVTGCLFIYGGAVRLWSLRMVPAEQRLAGTLYGALGVAIGVAIIVGALKLYLASP